MKLDISKKILLLGLILLIIAGVIVIALKGLNVSLLYREHEAINIALGKEINYEEFKQICKDVFKDKEVIIRKIEFFNDSININVESITDEEKEALITKLNEKYFENEEEKYTSDNLTVRKIPNIRLRDVITPYIKPVAISGLIILLYMLVRFKNKEAFKVVGKILMIMLLTELAVLSLIAIIRIPVSAMVINIMLVIGVIELVVYCFKLEKNN